MSNVTPLGRPLPIEVVYTATKTVITIGKAIDSEKLWGLLAPIVEELKQENQEV